MSRQVSRDSAGDYQADEQAGVAGVSWRLSHPTPVLPGDRPGRGARRETRSGPSDTHRAGDLGATDGKRDKSPPANCCGD